MEKTLEARREDAAQGAFYDELYRLLGEKAARYTRGQSSSLRAETAQALLEGILYTIDAADADGYAADAAQSVKARYEAGVRALVRLQRRGKLLLQRAQAHPLPAGNRAARDTLASLGGFFARYDADFFPQNIPADIDHPLCEPVSEACKGIAYVNAYLRAYNTEADLLRRFSARELDTLYRAWQEDYEALIFNLCAPAAEAALRLALAGRFTGAVFPPDDLGRYANVPPAQLEAALEAAAGEVCMVLGVRTGAEATLLQKIAAGLLPRLQCETR